MTDALVPGGSRELRLESWLTAYGDAVLRMCFLWDCGIVLDGKTGEVLMTSIITGANG